ncbi:hypothetical protein GPJ56_008200 [Histomonas meleagridis]|uniref:uncharacterized protein n=1 Tax=Histomonas meleagridis TaxID=135588 RepID=UPI003559E0B9|nr:hypothetical protein GPJ56_008200 [Histomonas meleagridis]KAH0797221.1 hypothetical protein GO595_009903 [Histomonas meleagridis]
MESCTAISELKKKISSNIPQFPEESFYLSLEYPDGFFTSVDSVATLDNFPKKLTFLLSPLFSDVVVNFVDATSKTYKFNLKDDVGENIKSIIQGPIEKYVLCFRLRNDQSFVQSTTHSLPLPFQQWTCEPLYLLRRITHNDLSLLSDPINTKEFYAQCRFATSLQLSVHPADTNLRLAVLRYIIEGGDPLSAKQKLIPYIPVYLRSEELVEITFKYLETYKNLTPPSAAREYVELSVRSGSLCNYIERVKFLVLGKKWSILSHRFLYISTSSICISKEYGSGFYLVYPISSIEKITIVDSIYVIINFKDEQWKIKSERCQTLTSAIQEIQALVSNESENEYTNIHTPEQSTPILPTTEIHEELQMMSSSDATDEYLSTDLMKLFTKKESLGIGYVQVQPGISQLICPKEEECGKKYVSDEHMINELSFTKPLNVPPLQTVDSSKIEDIDWYINDTHIQSLISAHPRIFYAIFILLLAYVLFK